jgi:glycosyltransferase involved in cell wall biosynthesis
MKTLIFFTSQFPYSTGETFIENEMPFLSAAFEKIIIVSNELSAPQTRNVPGNVQVIRASYEVSTAYKLKTLSKYFGPIIQNELHFIKHKLKLKTNRQILSALLGSYAKALETAKLIEKLVTEYQIDSSQLYLYSYWMNNNAAAIALYRKRHPEVKAFCRAHGWDVYFERHAPAYLPLKSFILQNINACFCVSQNGMDYLNKTMEGGFTDKLKIGRLGTFNRLGKAARSGTEGLSIASCSSIIALKRIHLIIEALALIPDMQVKWTHFGNGPLENEMRRLAKVKLDGLTNVQYNFAGQVTNNELLDYYQNNPVDIFMNVSETEGLPVSIMEANSFGIPVIATDVGGVPEIITDGENGFLVAANPSAAELAGTIKRFYQLPEEAKSKMRANAFRNWDNNFNAKKNYYNFIETIKLL